MKMKRTCIVLLIAGCACLAPSERQARTQPRLQTLHDPMAELVGRFERGEVQLEFQAGTFGYLPGLLRELKINVDTQVLVFSKTSLQIEHISPRNPRAIYFNDTTAVGYIPGAELLEIASVEPSKGVTFYTLKNSQSAKPQFSREVEQCLKCHGPANTSVSPGIMVTSVFPSPDGTPFTGGSTLFNITDQTTPFEDRWGGWYVTGTHGDQKHLGNAIARDLSRPFDLETAGTQNVVRLDNKIDIARYPASSSDIVALMVLEHQTKLINLMTRMAALARVAAQRRDAAMDKRLDELIDQVVDYMLFKDETKLQQPIAGVSTFSKTFPLLGPSDKKGRSLRELDLRTRLFRYPLSYLIFSDVFDAIPSTAKDKIYRRIFDALTGNGEARSVARLSSDERRTILEIVRATKTNLPEYWHSNTNN
jgi:hypothetical protein